jgi:toxin ParE1/3/4
LIQRTPLLYQLRPDIGQDARLESVGHYAILFRVSEDAVRIDRIVYGGRDLANLMDAPTRSG